jgi:hypothetical protein
MIMSSQRECSSTSLGVVRFTSMYDVCASGAVNSVAPSDFARTRKVRISSKRSTGT